MGCLGEFLFAAEQLDLAEDVTGIAMQFVRNRVEQGLGVGCLAIGRNPCLGQGDLIGAQPLGGAQRGVLLAAVEHEIHPRLLIARRQQRAEQIKRRVLGVLGHGIAPPCLAHQTFRVGPVAARDHDARQRESAFG